MNKLNKILVKLQFLHFFTVYAIIIWYFNLLSKLSQFFYVYSYYLFNNFKYFGDCP